MDQKIMLLLFKEMLLTRLFQKKLLEAGINAYTEKGEEAISVGSALGIGDSIISCYFRGEGSALRLKQGIGLKDQMAWWLGRKNNLGVVSTTLPSAYTDVSHRVIGTTSSLIGGDMDVAVGVAMAQKKKQGGAVLFMCGDGATSKGNFHEMLNFSSLYRLPFIIMVRGNGWAMSTPVSKNTHVADITWLGDAFGIKTLKIDGNDVCEVYETVKAAEKSVQTDGPVMIYAKTYRMSAHSAHDEDEYRTPSDKTVWEDKDPILRLERRLEEGEMTREEVSRIKKGCSQQIEEAYAWACRQPVIPVEEYLYIQRKIVNNIYKGEFA